MIKYNIETSFESVCNWFQGIENKNLSKAEREHAIKSVIY
jgi:hypothetical protein